MPRFPYACFALLLLSGCVSGGVRTADRLADVDIGGTGLAPAGSRRTPLQQTDLQRVLDRPEFRLDDLLAVADMANPEILAARHTLGAAAGRTWQAELYPNATLELEAEDVPTRHADLSRSQNTVSLTQPIIVGGRRSAAVAATTAAQEAQSLKLEAKRWEVLGDVRLIHAEIIYLRHARALHGELLEIAGQTFDIAKTRFNVRAVPELEVIESEIEVHKLELATRRLERQMTTAAARLRTLLGDVEIRADRIVGELPMDLTGLDLGRLRAMVEENHPMLLAAQQDIAAADHRIAQARAERIPDIGVRLAYGRNTAADEHLVEAGISVPLPIFDRNQGKILETRHLAQVARNEAESLASGLDTELTAAYTAYMTARDEVDTFEARIVPAAGRALSQARNGYQAGRTSLLNVLDAQRTLAWARLSLLDSLRDATVARYRIWKITGPGLEQ